MNKIFESFKETQINEKAYRLTNEYSAKGLVGKVMQAFKKQIEKIKFDGDVNKTLKLINQEWSKFENNINEIVMTQVENAVKDLNSNIVYVNTNAFDMEWREHSKNKATENQLWITLGTYGEMVINIGYMDDAKLNTVKKIDKDAYKTMALRDDANLYGTFDPNVTNFEIRSSETMLIDNK